MDVWNKIKNMKSGIKSFSTFGITNLISNTLGGLFWLYVAGVLGTNNYGQISYLIAAATVASGIGIFGSGSSLVVYTAKQVKIEAVIFSLTIIFSSIAAIILYLIFYNVGVSLYVIGNTVFSLATAYLIGQKSYKQFFIYTISQRILGIVLAIILNYYIGYNGVILGLSISFFIMIPQIYGGFKISKIDFSLLRTRIGFILNNFVMETARIFSFTFDKLLAAPLLGYSLLGNYQLAVQFLTMMSIIPGIMYQYTLSHDSSGESTKKLKRGIILFSVIVTILGIILAPFIVHFLFPKFNETILVFQIISLSIIPTTINLTYISKFLGNEKSRIVLIGSIIYLSVQIVLIIILGKIMSVNGVAIAIVVSAISETIYLFTIDKIDQKKNQTKNI